MLRERRDAVQQVATDFVKAERAVDEAAMLAANCMATMIAQRAAARLPVTTGLDALDRLAETTTDLVRARRRLMEAHGDLARVRDGIGIRSYGDISECPDAESASIRLVATA